MDKDFGKFIFREDARHSGLVRLPDVPATTRIELMEKVLNRHSQALGESAIITIRGGRIRVSRSPL